MRQRESSTEQEIVLIIGKLAVIAVTVYFCTSTFASGVFLGKGAIWLTLLAVVIAFPILVFQRIEPDPPASSPPTFKTATPKPMLSTQTTVVRQRFAPVYTPPKPPSLSLEDQLAAIDWYQFEKLFEIAFGKKGYYVTRRGGGKADGGIDLIIKKGGESTAVQCKNWLKCGWKIQPKTVRELIGSMAIEKIGKGILITTSSFTEQARDVARQNSVEPMDYSEVVRMLRSLGAESDTEFQRFLNDKTKYCPKCERVMQIKTAGKGAKVGRNFWGCSGYPRHCRYRMDIA